MRDLFAVPNLVALAGHPDVVETLRAMNVVTISRSESVASVLEGSLERGRRTTSDIGLGQGEIYEVTVQAHSPVIGKTLKQLRPQSWILGAIYREGRLVVPHGNTAIESGDRCLLIGAPAILQGIADYFQRGSSEFPLQFGTRYCLIENLESELPDLAECQWLVEHTEAKDLGLIYRGETAAEQLEPRFAGHNLKTVAMPPTLADLTSLTDDLDCAMIVAPALKPGLSDRWGFGNRNFFALLDETSEPVLISRGTQPYKRILVAVSPSPGSLRAAELAVDVSRMFDAALTVVAVEPPDFVVGSEYREKLERRLEAVRSNATLYSRRIETLHLEGNPVTQVLGICQDFDLLVIAHRRHRKLSLTRTDVSRHLAVSAPCSVMVLPFSAGDLPRGA